MKGLSLSLRRFAEGLTRSSLDIACRQASFLRQDHVRTVSSQNGKVLRTCRRCLPSVCAMSYALSTPAAVAAATSSNLLLLGSDARSFTVCCAASRICDAEHVRLFSHRLCAAVNLGFAPRANKCRATEVGSVLAWPEFHGEMGPHCFQRYSGTFMLCFPSQGNEVHTSRQSSIFLLNPGHCLGQHIGICAYFSYWDDSASFKGRALTLAALHCTCTWQTSPAQLPTCCVCCIRAPVWASCVWKDLR